MLRRFVFGQRLAKQSFKVVNWSDALLRGQFLEGRRGGALCSRRSNWLRNPIHESRIAGQRAFAASARAGWWMACYGVIPLWTVCRPRSWTKSRLGANRPSSTDRALHLCVLAVDCKRVELFVRTISGAPRLSRWAKWLVSSPDRAAQETLRFLWHSFTHLAPSTQGKVLRRVRNADSSNVGALLHEILIFDVCRRFGLHPEFEPRSHGQTPDLRLRIANRSYLADVFVTTRPVKTLINFEGHEGWQDSGEAAKKIADTLDLKATKYRGLNAPLLLFTVFDGHDVGPHDLETALYGSTVGELSCTGGLGDKCHKDWHLHGLFCPPGPHGRHRTVSAVIGCDWFDSLARTGRRLHCVVYHHWHPEVVLPLRTFGRFPDVHFLRDASGRWIPTVTGTPNLVMSTTPGDSIQWAPYSADDPW